MAMVSNDEPALVNLPRSAIAKGHSAGHINEHPKAMRKMQQTEKTGLGTTATAILPTRAMMAQMRMAAA